MNSVCATESFSHHFKTALKQSVLYKALYKGDVQFIKYLYLVYYHK